MRRLPECMPIVRARMEAGGHTPSYVEREIQEEVDLCDRRGNLSAAARGWSRVPRVRANLSGHWPRKKRWNFWNWISPDFVLSVVLADIDYASLCTLSFIDFESGERLASTSLGRPGRFRLPERVDESVDFSGGGVEYHHRELGSRMQVRLRGPTSRGREIAAEFEIERPSGQESLNVVVPWTERRFQLNSKHNTLPCRGEVRVGSRRYAMDPARCHAVQDWGRGVWPYRSFWNWAVCTGTRGRDRIGVNMGARWTTGTGANENGILVNGRLEKVMEDLRWSYDPDDWMKPWRVRSEHSDAIDLTLVPFVLHRSQLSLGVLASGGVCAFGRWSGTIRFQGDEIPIADMVGWAEEFAHRW